MQRRCRSQRGFPLQQADASATASGAIAHQAIPRLTRFSALIERLQKAEAGTLRMFDTHARRFSQAGEKLEIQSCEELEAHAA